MRKKVGGKGYRILKPLIIRLPTFFAENGYRMVPLTLLNIRDIRYNTRRTDRQVDRTQEMFDGIYLGTMANGIYSKRG